MWIKIIRVVTFPQLHPSTVSLRVFHLRGGHLDHLSDLLREVLVQLLITPEISVRTWILHLVILYIHSTSYLEWWKPKLKRISKRSHQWGHTHIQSKIILLIKRILWYTASASHKGNSTSSVTRACSDQASILRVDFLKINRLNCHLHQNMILTV